MIRDSKVSNITYQFIMDLDRSTSWQQLERDLKDHSHGIRAVTQVQISLLT